MEITSFFQIVLYILSSVLLIVLIFLGVQALITLNKVDKVIDDISEKSKKVDGLFTAVDKVTDAISSVNDKLVGIVFNVVNNIVEKIKHKKEKENNDE